MDASPIGVIRTYDDLLSVISARMAALNVTLETVDAVSGVQMGYSAKLLGPAQKKMFGPMSLGTILGALGLKLLAVEDPEQMARVHHRMVPRRKARQKSHWRYPTQSAG
jgi:hypothetical protein